MSDLDRKASEHFPGRVVAASLAKEVALPCEDSLDHDALAKTAVIIVGRTPAC